MVKKSAFNFSTYTVFFYLFPRFAFFVFRLILLPAVFILSHTDYLVILKMLTDCCCYSHSASPFVIFLLLRFIYIVILIRANLFLAFMDVIYNPPDQVIGNALCSEYRW